MQNYLKNINIMALWMLAFSMPGFNSNLIARSFDQEYAGLRIRMGNAGLVDTALARRQARLWRNQPYLEPAFAYPQPMQPNDSNQNRMRYQKAYNIYLRARYQIESYQEKNQELKHQSTMLEEALWWKQIDAQATLQRRHRNLMNNESHALVTLSQQGINWLDAIDSRQLDQSTGVQKLRAGLYRIYIAHQVHLARFEAALAMLKRMQRQTGMQQEWTMQYYFSVCESAKYRKALRNRGIGDRQLRKLRRSKNLRHLLAVELRFGKASPEYQAVKARIDLEELGAPRRPLQF